MGFQPWMTSTQLIDSIKRKISLPLSQNTFSALDLLAFANEEMFISQVPSVLQFHEEYFVTYKVVPLQTNVSRYQIPNRAVGIKLRDLFWQDTNGNLFEMTRIDEHDKAFFQMNAGANQAVHKFYVEGNDVILTPSVVDSPTGSLVFVFYLRPNQLVKNDRASTIQHFSQLITLNNSLINPLDTFSVSPLSTAFQPYGTIPFTAVNSLGGTISTITIAAQGVVQITSVNHQLSTDQTVTISGSNSNPSIDGTYQIQVLSPDTFTIPFLIATPGNSGIFTSPNQFSIGATGTITAANLSAAINSLAIIDTTTSALNVITMNFHNIYIQFSTSNAVAFSIPTQNIGVVFDQVNSTYTDQETNITEPLFVPGTFIDLLQQKPGHRTYLYDLKLSPTAISGLTVNFTIASLLIPTGTVNNVATSPDPGSANQPGIQFMVAPLVPGDYMCLANEAIIPQIPPDLHNGLAERTAARILAAIGDQAGLQASNAKIQEIDSRQGNLLNNRAEGTPPKITARHSLLRYGKQGPIRRT